MNNSLVPAEVLGAKEQEIRRLTEGPARAYVVNTEDVLYGGPFRHYLLFSDRPSLEAVGLGGLDELTAFYNRYYWFLIFSKLHMIKHGHDAGLEQQAFRLLEYSPDGIDWAVVEDISKLAEQDVRDVAP